MAECFCGCGRDVPRGINKQGGRTVGLLGKVREARDLMERGGPIPDPKKTAVFTMAATGLGADDVEAIRERTGTDNPIGVMVIEYLGALVEAGEEYEVFWIDAAHGDYLPPPSEARAIKKAWTKWGREGMGICRTMGIHIPRFGAITSGS